jgi:hypothetical protein
MIKQIPICLLAVLLLTAPPAEAQQPKKVPRIGMLMSSSASSQRSRLDDFRNGLRELGYVERQTILIEYRYANGKLDQLPVRAILSGVYPAFVNSSASETRIRVPLKIKRPRQTRLSAARCLPISRRAIGFLPPRPSLYQLQTPIKSSPFRSIKIREAQPCADKVVK